MLKGPLWKNIGKEDSQPSEDSSLSSGRPIKAFHIMFEDDNASKSERASRDRVSQFFRSGSIKEEEMDVSPMIITEDGGDRKLQNEEVMEIISFDSLENGKMVNMNNMLKSLSDINEPPTLVPSCPIASPQSQLKPKVAAMQKILHLLKGDMQAYKEYLLNAMSDWQVNAISAFKTMRESIDKYLLDVYEESRRPKGKLRDSEELNNKCIALQQEINILNKTLANEKESAMAARRESMERQEKLKRSQHEHRYKVGNDQTLVEELKAKNKKLQYQLSEVKLESQSQASKVSKLKEVIKEREQYISTQSEELLQLQKKMKEVKLASEDSSNRERRYQIELKALRQRLDKETSAIERQLSRSKQECVKLKSLLKTSEEQLVQCEQYINKSNNDLKDLKATNSKLHEAIRENEVQYYKKLQECDKYLIELENSIKEMTMNNQYKAQEYEFKEAELFRMREDYEQKVREVQGREYEAEERRKEYEHRLSSLELREQGLRAEYKMAIESQNAVKDKWYQRYYMISPQRQKNIHQPIPQRDITPISSGRPSFTRKDVFQIPIREVKSPSRLAKAKSEKNINIHTYRSDGNLNSPRNDFDRSDSQRGIINLGSRINTLRKELTRELGQMGYN